MSKEKGYFILKVPIHNKDAILRNVYALWDTETTTAEQKLKGMHEDGPVTAWSGSSLLCLLLQQLMGFVFAEDKIMAHPPPFRPFLGLAASAEYLWGLSERLLKAG